MNWIHKFLFAIVIMFASTIGASQAYNDYDVDYIFDVEVTVKDAVTDVPIEGATLKLITSLMTKTNVKVKTDENGKGIIVSAVRRYYISVEKKGYRTKMIQLDEKKTTLEVTLNPKK